MFFVNLRALIIHEILLKYWGYSAFRPLQEDIINSVLQGKDTLALMPTGGGKSLCFQVPAMAKEGVCLVISPLIALMKDQVHNLKKRGIIASAIFSGMNKREIDIVLENCIHGKTKFLYLSPERLTTEIFRERVKSMKVSLLAVDEAHCISQWGYDFRPPYLQIAELRELLPDIPILALTATATEEVKKDIQQKLKFKNENVFQKSFERKNLSYAVLYEEGKLNKMADIFQKVKGSGIVYVRNRKKTKEIAEHLQRKKIVADFYHAGLDAKIRSDKQDRWINNKTRIMVCTNAFGMGIDKPDVRVVVHLDLPESLEAYYQEAGRAGRDEKKSYAVLFYTDSDKFELERKLKENFSPIEEIKQVYQALGNYFQIAIGAGAGESFDFEIADFCNTYKFKPSLVFNSIKILEQNNLIATTDSVFIPSRAMLTVNKNELYQFELENKKFEPIIKVILRSYEGVFENFTPINETELARILKTEKTEVADLLHKLHEYGIIHYAPVKNKPQIVFLLPREDKKYLNINKEFLEERKKVYEKKIKSVIRFSSEKTICRSSMLLEYFGEKNISHCRICDVCLKRNKLELNDSEFENIQNEIKNILSVKPMGLHEIVGSIGKYREDKVLKTIQWLRDNRYLTLNEDKFQIN